MRIHIREARIADFLGIRACLSVFQGRSSDGAVSREYLQDVFKESLANVMRKTYVAIGNGKVIGTATLHVDHKLFHAGKRAARIEDVAVCPGCQKQGVGQALVNHLVGVAEEEEAYKVTLSCKKELVGFYEKIGFEKNEVEMRIDLCQ